MFLGLKFQFKYHNYRKHKISTVKLKKTQMKTTIMLITEADWDGIIPSPQLPVSGNKLKCFELNIHEFLNTF